MEWFSAHWLDMLTTALGLLYIWLEYRSSIVLWFVGIIMPALDIFLYWDKELFGDSFMAGYYTVAHIWGFLVWKFGFGKKDKKSPAIGHLPVNKILPLIAIFAILWYATYWVLVNYTKSTIPMADAFTNALSFIALWALSRKYVEQWLLWIVVDAVSVYLYVIKDVPFKAGLYSLYIIIAVLGYRQWLRKIDKPTQPALE